MCRNTGIKVYISHIKVEKQETHGSHRSPEQRFLVSFYISFFKTFYQYISMLKFKHLLGPQYLFKGYKFNN